MKYIILLTTTMLLLTNCHKDSGVSTGGSTTSGPIAVIGMWTVDSTTKINYINDTAQAGSQITTISTPQYFNFYSSTKVLYVDGSIKDSTSYSIVHNDTLIMDFNKDNIIDTAGIVVVVPTHKIKITWDFYKGYAGGKKYTTTQRFYLRK